MKIVTFWGGLGNQIMEYAYVQWLSKQYPGEKIYGFYPKVGLSGHNGLEIQKWFEVSLPQTTVLSNLLGNSFFLVGRLFAKLKFPKPLTCTMRQFKTDRMFHCDYWQDLKFMPESFSLKYRNFPINAKNQKLLNRIQTENAIAVHIRRGDFLKPNTHKIYGDICTEKYYKEALDSMRNDVEKPLFVFFSDDAEYCKQTYRMENMIVVDWNKGEDSFFDMYLMSHCPYMILANSTFSYWAARLNKRARKIICPERWVNGANLNLSLKSWKVCKS